MLGGNQEQLAAFMEKFNALYDESFPDNGIVEDAKKLRAPAYIATLWAEKVAQTKVKKNQEALRGVLMGALGLTVDIVEDDNYNDVAVLKVQS